MDSSIFFTFGVRRSAFAVRRSPFTVHRSTGRRSGEARFAGAFEM
jgi:hypothetical protein